MSRALTINPLSPAKSKPCDHNNPTPKPIETPLPSLVSLLSKCTTLRERQQLHALAIKSHLQDHPSLLTKLITSCCLHPKTSSMDYAHRLFDRIPHPDVVLFNTMSRGYSRSHTPIQSFSLFIRMLETGVAPDDYTFPSLLKACASARASKEGMQAHGITVKLGLAENIYVRPTLVNMYAECGSIRAARTLFDGMEEPCVVSYNSMITACVRSSRPSEALALFRELQAKGLKPTDVTMLSVLSSCALSGALELGKWIHEYIRRNGFDSYIKVNTALIDMYAKCGSLEDAVQVFRETSSKDTQAWSAMIVAYAVHGHGSKAISLFEEMQREGIKPDDITFLGVLYACSHSGRVDEGLGYFHSMRSGYGIVPGIKHYGCVVDLLARAGRLDEAYDFIDGLPNEPTPILWRTLLSACGGHGNVDLGKRVFERILELDDSHGGDYVILSNMCASDGRWEDVNRIRKLMGEQRIVKVPGCSSIEVDNMVHEFFSGDGKHPQSREVYRMVDEVVNQLKLVGYVPDTCQVFHVGMGEEDKEVSLRYHSEKLAIAFGLINSPPGTALRVVKNLRVCRDCHSMAKLVSMVFDRKIILRDLNRFHHFENGLCSCGDYW
ncbi:pentatricopeptide repeat-containing protein At2g02980, chloroplastic [Phoenix dactylifera]|uniref:Pentatricopeptide repeat-containing protein At2g02980, chloroplastic n=1 Tax=Phoenix dactylifera TaxID=42345 RepID=A0A8B7CTG6_PHODC|nr:pentatricopeptide repeat-containing protein At2g02980, chloroplastic [Phoenix dactylifera]